MDDDFRISCCNETKCRLLRGAKIGEGQLFSCPPFSLVGGKDIAPPPFKICLHCKTLKYTHLSNNKLNDKSAIFCWHSNHFQIQGLPSRLPRSIYSIRSLVTQTKPWCTIVTREMKYIWPTIVWEVSILRSHYKLASLTTLKLIRG